MSTRSGFFVALATLAGGLALSPRNAHAQSFRQEDLSDWRDPLTGSPSRMTQACGLLIEARLSGSPLRAFAHLMLANEGQIHARLTQVSAQFPSGVKLPLRVLGTETLVPPGQWRRIELDFPSKEELAEPSVVLELVLDRDDTGPCHASVELRRSPEVPLRAETYTPYLGGEFAMGVNAHFAAFGGLRTIARNANPGFDFHFTRFVSMHHGFGLELGVTAFGTGGSRAIGPDADFVSGAYLLPGYELRLAPLPELELRYALNVGPYGIGADNKDPAKDSAASTWSFAIEQKLTLAFETGWGGGATNVTLGPTFIATILRGGQLGSTSTSGELLSAAVYLSAGF